LVNILLYNEIKVRKSTDELPRIRRAAAATTTRIPQTFMVVSVKGSLQVFQCALESMGVNWEIQIVEEKLQLFFRILL
jgi:hypothetical protein